MREDYYVMLAPSCTEKNYVLIKKDENRVFG